MLWCLRRACASFTKTNLLQNKHRIQFCKYLRLKNSSFMVWNALKLYLLHLQKIQVTLQWHLFRGTQFRVFFLTIFPLLIKYLLSSGMSISILRSNYQYNKCKSVKYSKTENNQTIPILYQQRDQTSEVTLSKFRIFNVLYLWF